MVMHKKKQVMKKGGMAKKRGGGMMMKKMAMGGKVSPRKAMAMGMTDGGMAKKKSVVKKRGGGSRPLHLLNLLHCMELSNHQRGRT